MDAQALTGRKSLIVLAFIPLLTFVWLGFKGLPQQGILFHDVGMNLLEATFIGEGVGLAVECLSEDAPAKTEGCLGHPPTESPECRRKTVGSSLQLAQL